MITREIENTMSYGELTGGSRDAQKAKQLFEDAPMLYPSDFSAFYNLGRFYHRQRDLPRAISYYLKALDKDCFNRDAIENLCDALSESGNNTDAQIILELYLKKTQVILR